MAFTNEEAAEWQTQLATFFKQIPGETAKDKRRRLARVHVTAPRIATLDLARVLENALRGGTGKCLKDFDSAHLLPTVTIVDGVVQIPACASVRLANQCPNLLTMCGDRQSSQLACMVFLIYKLKLNCVFIPDPAHLGWRALLEALTRSGYLAVMDTAELIDNIAYGP